MVLSRLGAHFRVGCVEAVQHDDLVLFLNRGLVGGLDGPLGIGHQKGAPFGFDDCQVSQLFALSQAQGAGRCRQR